MTSQFNVLDSIQSRIQKSCTSAKQTDDMGTTKTNYQENINILRENAEPKNYTIIVVKRGYKSHHQQLRNAASI